MATRYDIPIKRGNSFRRTFRFLGQDEQPVPLTGEEVVFLATWSKGGSLRKTTADGGMAMPNPASGEFELFLTKQEARGLPVGARAWYEMEHRKAGGDEETYFEGFLVVGEGRNDDAA
jgi:hypothetical protein